MNLTQLNKNVLKYSGKSFVTAKELGELFGENLSTITYYVEAQGMPREKRGVYNLKKCVKWYIAKLKTRLSQTSSEALNTHKIRLLENKSRKAELESKILSGENVSLEEIFSETAVIVESLKNGFSNLSTEISNKCKENKAEMYEFVEARKQEIFEKFAESLYEMAEKRERERLKDD